MKHIKLFEQFSTNENSNNALSSKVWAVATREQKEVIEEFESGTEYLFLMSPSLKGAVSAEAIDDALHMMVNSVEGDTSQLDPKHIEYAKAKGWLEGWED